VRPPQGGEDADAPLAAMRFYTLLGLHQVVPRKTCARKSSMNPAIKVLTKEYTESDD